MWNPDLQIHARGRNYRVPLKRRVSRIGRGTRNDIVLLDPSVAQEAGSIEVRGRSVLFRPPGGTEVDCRKREVRVGRCRFRAGPGRPFLVSLIGAASLAGAMLTLWSLSEPAGKSLPRVSRVDAIPLPARGIYGRLSEEDPPAAPLRFRFEQFGKGSLLLHYVPGGTLRGDQLLIELNGNPAGFVPASSGGWGIEQRLLIPSGRLRFGLNRISFVPADAGRENGRWGIRDVYLTSVPSPSADEESGASLSEAAERVYREGGSDLGELERAGELIRRGIGAFRVAGTKIPKRTVLLEREIAAARKSLFGRRMSEARKAARLGDPRRARSIYLALLSELPDPADLRRIEVHRSLKELEP